MRFLKNLSLRRKQTLIVMLINGVTLLLACAAFVTYDVTAFRGELMEDVLTMANVIGNNCTAALDFNDPKSAEQTLATLRAEPNVVTACIYGRDGDLFAFYQREGPGTAAALPLMKSAGHELAGHEFRIFQPILARGETVGTIYLAHDLRQLDQRIKNYVVIVTLVLVAVMLVAFGLSRRLQRLVSDPILQLAQVTQSVAVGKNYSVRATKQNNDELGQLVDGFNEMLEQIQARDTALQMARDNLERRVEERTNELAEASSLMDVLMMNSLDFIYFKDRQSRFIRYSRTLAQHFSLADPAGLIGKTDFDCYEDARARSAFEDEQQIMRTGQPVVSKLEKGAGIDGRVSWMLTTKMPWRDSSEKMIGTFGVSTDVTTLKEAEIALAETSGLLEALLANSPDSIYFKDRQSRFVRCSRSMAQLFGVSDPGELIGKSDLDFFREQHARSAFDDEQKIIRTGEPVINKLEKETHRDGRITWVLTTKLPRHDGEGNIVGTFGISRDVTTIQEAEAKLEQIHKELLETSRRAGMAEIATNVLHNVGNVLNSVNVSASLVTDSVKKSKASGLAKVVGLLQEHAHDLGAFIANDTRGKHLATYLAQLSTNLQADQTATLRELELLRANIEHIKEIVAMQQNYAKVSGLKEIVNVQDLVEDSLRMNDGSLIRHGLHVIREFENVPPISVEKHKILQILVNLVRNAKYACEDSGRKEKRLTVRVASGEGRIRIAVSDNGVGIQPENLTRIFNHGFTTRKEGHGFGLHSGALAAKEMGGALTVHSDGPGCGATFVLELPSVPAGPGPAPSPGATI